MLVKLLLLAVFNAYKTFALKRFQGNVLARYFGLCNCNWIRNPVLIRGFSRKRLRI